MNTAIGECCKRLIDSYFLLLFIKSFLTNSMILETQRLILREFELGDAETLYRLNLDPAVIRYTGDVAFDTIDDAANFIANYDDYHKNGYGRWAMIDKETAAFVGWCGLKYNADSDETDIGFRLFTNFWNTGFATEAAKACVDYGFNTLHLTSIIG